MKSLLSCFSPSPSYTRCWNLVVEMAEITALYTAATATTIIISQIHYFHYTIHAPIEKKINSFLKTNRQKFRMIQFTTNVL